MDSRETLVAAKVGGIYNFDYCQPFSGETRRHLAKVVEVRKLTDADMARIHAQSNYRRWDSGFERTETIVTCQMPNGSYRNFYAERTENCTQSALSSFLFWSGVARLMSRR